MFRFTRFFLCTILAVSFVIYGTGFANASNGVADACTVSTPGGVANSVVTTPAPPSPVINSFTPTYGESGEEVHIYGSYFTKASKVLFGGTPADHFTVQNDSTIVAYVANGSTGPITVYTPGGTVTSTATFTFYPAPIIDSFSPTSGKIGDAITIYGSCFTYTYEVDFGDYTEDNFTVVDDNTIVVYLDSGDTGTIAVYATGGEATSATAFTFYQPPEIDGFDPESGSSGDAVTIYGSYFTGTSAVDFGGTPAASFTVQDDSTIVAHAGAGAPGPITVTTPGGTATSADTFSFAPIIASFNPTFGVSGDAVTIHGQYFTGTYEVDFGDDTADHFTVTDDNTIVAHVGDGDTGHITVYTNAGEAVSTTAFTFYQPPEIDGFDPESGSSGDAITIYGSNFTGTSAVDFGGTPAASFTVQDDSTIVAHAGAGAPGPITVTTPGGTATSADTFSFAPIIASFNPTFGVSGDAVTIHGQYFTGTYEVDFGDDTADHFTVTDDHTIVAYVGDGDTGSSPSTPTPARPSAPPPSPSISRRKSMASTRKAAAAAMPSPFTGATSPGPARSTSAAPRPPASPCRMTAPSWRMPAPALPVPLPSPPPAVRPPAPIPSASRRSSLPSTRPSGSAAMPSPSMGNTSPEPMRSISAMIPPITSP